MEDSEQPSRRSNELCAGIWLCRETGLEAPGKVAHLTRDCPRPPQKHLCERYWEILHVIQDLPLGRGFLPKLLFGGVISLQNGCGRASGGL